MGLQLKQNSWEGFTRWTENNDSNNFLFFIKECTRWIFFGHDGDGPAMLWVRF